MAQPVYALVDCNNFFVSCERAFQPHLENKPVLVLSSNDGCVISRSQEVKDLGVPMGAPLFQWKDFMEEHGIIYFSSNFSLYGDISHRVMETLYHFTDNVEVYSIDEAFLTLDPRLDLITHATTIRSTIRRWTRIPTSIGIAPTKVLAKVASHIAKRHPEHGGVFRIDESNTDQILHDFPVAELWGIGRKSTEFLRTTRIHTALELKNMPDAWIKKNLTIHGLHLVYELRGTPCFKLETHPVPKKGIVSSRSFGKPHSDLHVLQSAAATHASRLGEKLREEKQAATYIYAFIRTNRFTTGLRYAATKGMQLPIATNDTPTLIAAAQALVNTLYKKGFAYNKVGVGVTHLTPETTVQGNLFTPALDQTKSRRLMKTIDSLNKHFGSDTIRYATTLNQATWQAKSEHLSQRFTTSFKELPTAK